MSTYLEIICCATNNMPGFVPRRSFVAQLLTALNCWTKSLERGIPIDVVYLDFSKAFDSVLHERLLLKLRAYSIQGNTLFGLNHLFILFIYLLRLYSTSAEGL